MGHHLRLGLQGHGYPTTWCRTGGAALFHVTETKPGIVPLELGLPDLDGVELARHHSPRQPRDLADPHVTVADLGLGYVGGAQSVLAVLLDDECLHHLFPSQRNSRAGLTKSL